MPEEGAERPTIEATVHRCPTCNQHFSGDARFCPFDGDPLVVASAYRADADPLLGKLIDGRYEVESVLGEGGMGSVYAVRHRALDKRFALKVMRADFAQQGELAARFIQEARAAAAIGHPNIVQITDFGQLPTRAPYFVMELLDGTPLSKMIRAGGPLPFVQAVRIVRQTASALAAAHACGVIHRDLKPDNIHITKSQVVKILDFGVAKMAGAGRLTRTGMVFGTPHYMSPEQASGGTVDHRADIYALGIIMYEMFTGRVPFEADSYMGVLTKHMFMVPEPPSRVHEAARELGALEDVILRCLEKKAEARYGSMDELIQEIESIVQFTGDRLEVVRPSSSGRGVRQRVYGLADQLEVPTSVEVRALRGAGVPAELPPALLALGALALLILAFGIGYAFLRPAASPPPETLAVSAAPPAASGVPLTGPPAPEEAAPADPAPPRGELGAGASSSPLGGNDKAPSVAPKRAPARTAAGPKAAPSNTADASRGAGRAPPAPTSAHTSFSSGDIINPWAK